MIFVDSSFFIAIANRKDQWHEKARNLSEIIEKEDILISDLILSETVTAMGYLKGGKEGKLIYDYMKDNCKIEFADEDQYNQAIVTFLKYDGKLSLADALSVEVMKKYDVAEIVSFDSNFDRVSGILRIKE
jgi:hypothetical protein